ncbi:MAG: ABC transporter permease [Terriglobales bacterium]
MLKNLKLAIRTLLKTPGFTAVALLTLALGIGANTAIFTLIDATVLRPLPVKDPGQLVLLTDPTDGGLNYGTTNGRRGLLAYSEYRLLREQNNVFTGLMAVSSNAGRASIVWSGAGAGAERVETKLVSNNYFAVLGVPAFRGRVFSASQGATPGTNPIAVLSYSYWTRRFADSAAVLGSSFRLNGQVLTVVGVTPPGFFGEDVGQAPDLWLPLAMQLQVMPGQDLLHDPPGVSRAMWLQVMGRRKPGVTLAEALAASNAIFHHAIEAQAGEAHDAASRRDLLTQHLELSSGAQGVSPLRGQFADPLWALLALVGLVMAEAIVNLASLQLARATSRQKEMGVRLALGAGRGRVVRQLLTESVLLAVVGGLLGVLLALWGERLLLSLVSSGPGPGLSLSLTPDWRVLAFIAALCLASGVLFGLLPALRLSRMNLSNTLQAQGRSVHARMRLGKALVVGQVALSILLLVGAGLFVRSLGNLQNVALGFKAQGLALFGVDASTAGYKDAAANAYFHRLLDRLHATPGLTAAALSENGLFAHSEGGLPVAVEGYTPPGGQQGVGARFDEVSAGYFAAVGIPILQGRGLTVQDQSGVVRNTVINETMAKRFFAGRSPLGQQLKDLYPDDHGAVYSIVGVCADAKYNNLAEKTPPRFYLPFFNAIPGPANTSANVFVRGAGGAGAMAAGVRQAVQSLDANVQMSEVRNLTALVGDSLATQQMLAKLSGFFGLLALLLAAIGLYGIMAYAVARRTSEIGVRMALGATGGAVLRMVLGEALLLLAVGAVIGIPASLAGGKLVVRQMHLFDLRYYDPASLLGALGVLIVVTLLAGYLPALRASRIDPMRALRQE